MFCVTQITNYVFIRQDPKFNESQLKDYYLLSLVNSNKIPLEFALSSFLIPKPNQFVNEVPAEHGQ